MDAAIQTIIKKASAVYDRDPPASEADLNRIRAKFDLPPQYVDWLLWSGGGEGRFGQAYFSFWPVAELETLNRDFQIQKYLGVKAFCFGSDGGGVAYVFKALPKDASVWAVPLGDLDWMSARVVGVSLENALDNALTEKYVL